MSGSWWKWKRVPSGRQWWAGEVHPYAGLSAGELRALIERDYVADEEACLSANPLGRDTYYERVNGGPWQRRY